MKRVLIALDYDAAAQNVAKAGFSMAKSINAEVILLHVIADPVYYPSVGYSPIMGFTGIVNESPLQSDSVAGLEKASQHFLDKCKQLLGDKSIQTCIKKGDFAESILKSSKDLYVDIIVMGSHSWKWLEDITLGSATEKVLEHSSIPVFIIPSKQKRKKQKDKKNTIMKNNPLVKLETLGQSIWLDYIRNDMFESGELRQLIEKDGLQGMTSNPSLFEKAISESHIYDNDISALALQQGNAKVIYEILSQRDIQKAADEFRNLYEKTNGREGYVSLEVNPHLAHDTNGTIDEARRLWIALNRPNVLIKVPATTEGLPAIRQLISEGINVNVTLLFGLSRYRQVIKAYIAGLTARLDQGKPVMNVVSVASFFLSRIDSVMDPVEADFIASNGEQAHFATDIRGQVAISYAKIAYEIYKKTFKGKQFARLAREGALPQRLLWASTKTKNHDYSDIKYVEALIGPDTINTITLETLQAYRNHGHPALQLEVDVVQAKWVMSELSEVGINIKEISRKLEEDGIRKFIESFDKLLEVIAKKSLENTPKKTSDDHSLPGDEEKRNKKKQFKISIMKKETFIAVSLALIMAVSCSAPKKDNQKSTEPVQTSNPKQAIPEEKNTQVASETVGSGEKLYKDKGCLVCHQLNTKLVGPAVKDIAAAYSGNKAGLTAFLKGEGKAIVDPSQANVMQPQIAITKALPAEELNEIVDYILSIK